MTTKQRIMKFLYPTIMKASRKGTKGTILLKPEAVKSVSDSGLLTVELSNGESMKLSDLQGKKVLIINTASDCGYTPQFEEIQTLQNQKMESLIVIGFPANDFMEQEKGSNSQILDFCQLNFGVTFPLAKKSVVVRQVNQHPVFEWLSNSSKNGWNEQAPVWNFSKYLLDESGELLAYFGPAVSPNDEQLRRLIEH